MPKIETPEEFVTAVLDDYASSPKKMKDVFKSHVATRDAAIRAEYDALLKTCGEALGSIDAWWRLPNRERTVKNIEPAMRKTIEALAALGEAGAM